MTDVEQLAEMITSEELEKRFLRMILDAEDVERFLRTPAGRAIVTKAKADYMDAIEELAEVDLNGELTKAKALQRKAEVAKGVIWYLKDVILEGRVAADAAERLG